MYCHWKKETKPEISDHNISLSYLLEYLGQAHHESGHLIATDYLEEIICISFLYLTSADYVPLFPPVLFVISLLYW